MDSGVTITRYWGGLVLATFDAISGAGPRAGGAWEGIVPVVKGQMRAKYASHPKRSSPTCCEDGSARPNVSRAYFRSGYHDGRKCTLKTPASSYSNPPTD